MTRRLSNVFLFAAVCISSVATQVYTVAFYRTTRVEAKGQHEALLTEFADRHLVTQTFAMKSAGLEEIRIRLRTSVRADISFDWVLFEEAQGVMKPVRGNRSDVRRAIGEVEVPIRFTPIVASEGKNYRLDVRLVRFDSLEPADPHIGLVASLDDAISSGYLTVDGKERWGDLVFEVRAIGDTIWGRFMLVVRPTLPRGVQSTAALWCLFLFQNVLIAAFVIYFWPSVNRSSAITAAGAPVAALKTPPSTWSIARAVLVIAAFIAACATIYAERHIPPKIDLIDELYAADLVSPDRSLHASFQIVDRVVDEQPLRSVMAHPPSRITWTITVPAQAHLQTSLLIDPGAWTPDLPGDGVVFRILVSENGKDSELLMRHIDPGRLANDRHWVPVDIDMSAFSGRRLALIFKTEGSLPGRPLDYRNDWAMWGAPRLVTY